MLRTKFASVASLAAALALAALTTATVTPQSPPLAARGESLAAFDGRCIPGGCVAPPSNTGGILSRRALPAGRLARLGATPDFHHGLRGFSCVFCEFCVQRRTVWSILEALMKRFGIGLIV